MGKGNYYGLIVRNRGPDVATAVVATMACSGVPFHVAQLAASCVDGGGVITCSFGTVKGLVDEGRQIPPWTTIGGTFKHSEAHGKKEPFALPESWISAQNKLSAGTPFNFISTADIIGGNSGSPVVNKAGEVVGIIFDGNIQSLVLDYAFSDEQARAVSVHSAGIMEALKTVYNASRVVDELKK